MQSPLDHAKDVTPHSAWRLPLFRFITAVHVRGCHACLPIQAFKFGNLTPRGVLTRVLEPLSTSHQPEFCESCCTLEHSFHYVRLRPHRSTPVGLRGQWIDLKLDLHPRLRVERDRDLMHLDLEALEVPP